MCVYRVVLSTGRRRECWDTALYRWTVYPALWTVTSSVVFSGYATWPEWVSHTSLKLFAFNLRNEAQSRASVLVGSASLYWRVCVCVCVLSLRKVTWWSVSSSTWDGRGIGKSPPPSARSSNWSSRWTNGRRSVRRATDGRSYTACEYRCAATVCQILKTLRHS